MSVRSLSEYDLYSQSMGQTIGMSIMTPMARSMNSPRITAMNSSKGASTNHNMMLVGLHTAKEGYTRYERNTNYGCPPIYRLNYESINENFHHMSPGFPYRLHKVYDISG